MSEHTQNYFKGVIEVAQKLDLAAIDKLADELVAVRERKGRLFIIGVGGSAANCSHAVNDFRKLAQIETYAPTDNVSELTARTNDEGWDTVFAGWFEVSQINAKDAVLVFSVGGGNLEKNVSPNIIKGLQLAKERGARILGIIGRDGGFTKKIGDVVVVVPTVNDSLVTPIAESYQTVIWHSLVSNPKVQLKPTKW